MAYIGFDDKARKVKSVYIGVNNVARKVTTGYVGVDDVARQWWNEKSELDYPTMMGSDWIGNDLRGYITKITIVDYHTPNNPNDSWAIGNYNTSDVMAYRYGTEIIISGNGSGRIYTPWDASCLFGGDEDESVSFGTHDFYNLTEINGLTLLDTRYTRDMSLMFALSAKLTELDLTSFDTSNVESHTQMFWNCSRLNKIYVSADKWGIPLTESLTEGSLVTDFTYV